MTSPENPPGSRPARLVCGADPDELLAQAAEGRGAERDPHQTDCPHCQATLAEYTRLWAPFTELAGEQVHAPPGLMDRALATVRASAGTPGLGRVADEDGSFQVTAHAVVSVAGYAARTSAGVRMALSTLGAALDAVSPGASPGAAGQDTGLTAGVSGQSVALELTVAAEYGHDLHRLSEHLRERVADEVRAQIGLRVVEVDVTITDVFTPGGGGGGAGPVPLPRGV